MYFSLTFTLLLASKKTTLTKLLLLCERSVKFASKCKSLASNNEAILTYWIPLKNIVYMFYKRDSATFKHLHSLDRICLMSYKTHWMVNLKKRELKTSKSCLIFTSAEIAYLIAEARMFFLVFLSWYSFYIIPS